MGRGKTIVEFFSVAMLVISCIFHPQLAQFIHKEISLVHKHVRYIMCGPPEGSGGRDRQGSGPRGGPPPSGPWPPSSPPHCGSPRKGPGIVDRL